MLFPFLHSSVIGATAVQVLMFPSHVLVLLGVSDKERGSGGC